MEKISENTLIGKVKTVTILKQPTPTEFGLARFAFRDEYSIFDFGRMPDDIPFKGESLCRMAVYNFEELQKKGIKTHFVQSVSPLEFEVKTVRILYPDQNQVQPDSTNFLVPLEIIFRNSLPAGSSMLKRLKSGALQLSEIGLTHMPKEGEKLSRPIIDFTTKLEKSDRHLSRAQALELACLRENELQQLEQTALQVNDFLNARAQQIGLEHADGKIEMALDATRTPLLVDTFGTLDEDRFLFDGVHLSKQILRDYYAKTLWRAEIEKKEAGLPYHLSPPGRLPPELLQITSRIYQSVCEAWIGKKIWGAPSIQETVEEYRGFVERLDSELASKRD